MEEAWREERGARLLCLEAARITAWLAGVKFDLLHHPDGASCPWIRWLSMDITDINWTIILI